MSTVYRTTYWFAQYFALNYQPPSRESNFYGPLVVVPPPPPIPGGGGGGSRPKPRTQKKIVKIDGCCSLSTESTGRLSVVYAPQRLDVLGVGTAFLGGNGELQVLPKPKTRQYEEDEEEILAILEAYSAPAKTAKRTITISFRN